MENIKIVPGIYKHFKGNFYKVIDLAEDTETGTTMVVYKALYGERKTYARPLVMFMSLTDKEKYPEAEQEYRFEKINKLLIIQGYTATGKDYLSTRLQELGVEKPLGMTTRPIRPGEKNGREYLFTTEKNFLALEKREPFVAKRESELFGKKVFYGLRKTNFDNTKKQCVILDNFGTKQILDTLGEDFCEVIRLTTNKKTLEKRVEKRGDDIKIFKKRLKEDKKSFEKNYGYSYIEIDVTEGIEKHIGKIMNLF